MSKEVLSLIAPPRQKIIRDVSPYNISTYNLVRIPKAIREGIGFGHRGMDVQALCDEVKDVFPIDRCLYVPEEVLRDAKYNYAFHTMWFACKIRFLPYNHVEVALGTSSLPRELVYIQLGVWLSEFFNTDDSDGSILFKDGLLLFNIL